MINPRISAVWSSTKPIPPLSCIPRVQEVHSKAEVVHLNPGVLGLGVLFNCHAYKCIAKHMINPRSTSNKNIHFEMILDVGIGEKRKETRFLI